MCYILRTRSGISPGMALGFFWALGGLYFQACFCHSSGIQLSVAERRELYRFSADLAKVALRIAERYGTSGEKWSVYTSSLTHYTNVTGDNVQSRSSAFLLDGFRFR